MFGRLYQAIKLWLLQFYVYFSYFLIGLFFILLLFNSTPYTAFTYFYVVYPRTFGFVISLKSVLVTTVGLVLLSVIVTAYLRAMLTNPGSPRIAYPDVYEVEADHHENYCSKCSYYKPPNAHHCSQCKVCVMDMDHHCRKSYSAWLNTCIGADNLRFFVQFLVWAAVGCLFMVVLQADEAYGVFYRDYRYVKRHTALTRFMLMFSFGSCFVVRPT
jgi:hypothetical protein